MTSTTAADRFIALLAQHERALAAYVFTLVDCPADADDVLQQGKLTMWRSFDQFEPGTNFNAWARKIMFHQILAYRKKSKRDPVVLSDELVRLAAQAWEEQDAVLHRQRQALRECLRKLPPAKRDVLELRYGGGLKVEQIAEQTGRSRDAVYKLLHRLRDGLADCVTRAVRREIGE